MQEKQSLRAYVRSREFYCCVTGEKISAARVEYLLKEGIPESQLTSLNGAQHLHRPKKLIVIDDVGSEFICDHIDNTRAWESERFGSSEDSTESVERRTSAKRLDDSLLRFEYESLEAYIRKQDAGEEDSEDI